MSKNEHNKKPKQPPMPLAFEGKTITLHIRSDGQFILSGSKKAVLAFLEFLSENKLDVTVDGASPCG